MELHVRNSQDCHAGIWECSGNLYTVSTASLSKAKEHVMKHCSLKIKVPQLEYSTPDMRDFLMLATPRQLDTAPWR